MNWEVGFRAIVAVCVIATSLVIGAAAYEAYGMDPDGVGPLVFQSLEESGVTHSVTAVLLNFRAYDTFLEIVVLTTAFWGVWSLRGTVGPALSRPPGLLLQRVSAILIPALVILAVYLLWAGSHRPGGEFQAGAVLGAAGVLTLLVGRPVPGARRVLFRHLLVVAGAGVFIVIAALGWLWTGDFFGYRSGWEKILILVIELAAMVSVAFILVALFAGSVARLAGDVESRAVGPGASGKQGESEYRDLRAFSGDFDAERAHGGEDDS